MGGKIIAFEGCDGIGKTTLVNELLEYLRNRGYAARILKFPDYETSSGKVILRILNGEMGRVERENIDRLFIENFVEKLTHLRDFLFFESEAMSAKMDPRKPTFLLIDRYVASFAVYAYIRHLSRDRGGEAGDSSERQLARLDDFDEILKELPRAHHTILLDAPEDERWKRISERSATDFQLDENDSTKQKKLRETYLEWTKRQPRKGGSEKYHVLDVTALSVAETLSETVALIDDCFVYDEHDRPT